MTHIDEREDREYKHWATVVSEEAIERFGEKQVVATGWAPSGYYHIGNFKEAVTCRAIHRELLNLEAESSYILNIDNIDPFDKIPAFFKKDYGKLLHKYLGHAICDVPDPLGCHSSYADHFISNAIEIMDEFDVHPEPIKTSEMYTQGKYDKYAKLFIEKKEETSQLTEEITGSRMEEFFLVQCPKCKIFAAPLITDYRIESKEIIIDIHCKREKKGCGEKSTIKMGETLWKLKWRLDWAARQDFFGVTVESSGKDHGVAGGSIDTSLAIHKKIFNKAKLPLLIQHGFLTFGGKKLSGSSGSGMPVTEFPKILDPAIFLYKIYRSNLRTDFDFRVDLDIPSIASEFDQAEELFYQKLSLEHKKSREKTIKAYELALIGEPSSNKAIRVDYGHLATVMQVCLFDEEKIITRLKSTGIIPQEPDDLTNLFLSKRFQRVKYWIENYANDNIKFKILENPDCEIVKSIDQTIFNHLFEALQKLPNTLKGDDITQFLYEYSKKQQIKPKEFFQLIYLLFIGRKSGPRAGTLVDAISKNEVLMFMKKALKCLTDKIDS